MRISNTQKIFMISVAILLDLLQMVLFFTVILQHLIGFAGLVIFSLWFLIIGTVFSRFKRAGVFFAAALTETAVPFANLFPLLTFSVWWTIRDTQRSDKQQSSHANA